MKMKFGGATQSNWVASADWLTLVMLSWKSVPAPDNAVRSSEKAEIRRVLIGPASVRGSTLADTFQLSAVRPALSAAGSRKVTFLSSKVKSPWNPISFLFASISELVTAAMKSLFAGSMEALGNVTVATVEAGTSPALVLSPERAKTLVLSLAAFSDAPSGR